MPNKSPKVRDGADDDTFDAVVVGAGSAGLAFARQASALGQLVAIVEKDKIGGTCVNRGCVPKKLLWNLAHWQCHSARLIKSGLISAGPDVNVATALERIANRTAYLSTSIQEDLSESGIAVFEGECKLSATGDVYVGDTNLKGRYVVVATGAAPSRLDVPGADALLTSDAVFEWTLMPKTICLIGGGYIGTELSFSLSALGADVTIIEHGQTILDGFDPSATAMIAARLNELGVHTRTNDGIKKAETLDAGQVCVKTQSGWQATFDAAIDVTGRIPNVALLDEAGISLEPMPNDCIAPFRQTSLPHVFVIGDAGGAQQLTPVARFQGNALAHALFGAREDVPEPQTVLTTAVFADPPLAEIRRLTIGPEQAEPSEQEKQFDDLIEGILQNVSTRRFLARRGKTRDGAERLTMVADSAPEAMQLFAGLFEAGEGAALAALRQKSRIHPTTGEEWFEIADAL